MTRSAIEKASCDCTLQSFFYALQVYRLMHTLNSNSTLLTNMTSAISVAAAVISSQPVALPPHQSASSATPTAVLSFRTLIANDSASLSLNESSVFGTGAETSFFSEGEFELVRESDL